MDSRKLGLIRNIVLIVGIVTAFVIWIFLPWTFKNTPLFHVGNGEYGSKWGSLVLLPIPLFSLFYRRKKQEFYGDDEEYKKAEQEESNKKSMQAGLFTAIGLSILIVALMTVGLFL